MTSGGVQHSAQWRLLATLVASSAWLLTGCPRPDPNGQNGQPGTNPTNPAVIPKTASNAAGPSSPTPPPVSPPPASNTTHAAASSETAQVLASLGKEYRAAKGFDDRFEAAVRIGEVRNAESVLLLEQLFREEPDKDLRVELINALIGLRDCKDERLRLLTLGAAADQPTEVKEAAIDGLVDLVDTRALSLLQGLFQDPDPKIQALARQSRELAEKMVNPR
jgi:hypothetical protein